MEHSIKQTTPQSSGRITVIDAMRGIVLIGICLVHAMQHFGGLSATGAEPPYPWIGTMDEATNWIIRYFIFGKFFIIFSFLFGLSFFIQMDRAAQKGIDFRPRFLWRLALLFIIGFLHSAIFRLDILIIYAILGLPLVLLYRLPNKILVVIALFLMLGGVQLLNIGCTQWIAPVQEITQPDPGRWQRVQALLMNGTITENIRSNITEGLQGKFNFQFGAFGRGYITLGFFILGLLAGRVRLFHNLARYQTILYRAAAIVSVVLLALYVLQPNIPPEGVLLSWASMQVGNAINLLSAYLWVVVIIWLYQKESIQKALTRIVSYGQMGLTNYILQSVIGVFIFYGFGLALQTRINTFFSVLICLAYTILQIQFSYYWLKKIPLWPHRMGMAFCNIS